MPSIPWTQLETLIHDDPGGRGVASTRVDGQFLDAGQLQQAAESLASSARSVGIVTGFCIASATPPAAETDGPPGAIVLARTLSALGVEVTLLSDSYGLPLLRSACQFWGDFQPALVEIPWEDGDRLAPNRASNETDRSPRTLQWVDELLATRASAWTHLIAIERVGPSHTPESACLGAAAADQAAISSQVEREVSLEDRNACHNMRGTIVTGYTAKAHLLFEAIAARKLPIGTIGIADGGNEIGMGKIPWSVLREIIRIGPAASVACRVATDWLILAGVSNWGGYALAASVAALRDRRDVLAGITVDRLRQLIEAMVHDAGAVDGVTGQRTATVDGLPIDEYLRRWESIRKLLGIAAA